MRTKQQPRLKCVKKRLVATSQHAINSWQDEADAIDAGVRAAISALPNTPYNPMSHSTILPAQGCRHLACNYKCVQPTVVPLQVACQKVNTAIGVLLPEKTSEGELNPNMWDVVLRCGSCV